MQSEHAASRCPCCGGALRTLRLAGVERRHHQCLQCRHRHEDASPPSSTPARGADKLACLAALPPSDREIVESLILLMLGTGTLVGVVELTDADVDCLKALRGPPSATLRGFVFPVFSWLLDRAAHHASHFVAIDQGEMRVCFKVWRRRLSGPL